MLDPFSLSQSLEKVTHKEELMDSMYKKNRMCGARQRGQYVSNNSGSGGRSSSFSPKKDNSNPANPGTKLFKARRARGECYKYGDKYFVRHVCKNKQLNTMQSIIDQEG